MRNIWKVGALGAVFGAVLSVGGCNDFDTAYEKCVDEGRCGPDGGVADGGVDSGPVDPEPTCTPASDTDEPDPEGKDLNCDGVDGMASAGYFVDPVRGDDGNDGSARLPLKTLANALDRIRNNAGGPVRTNVYLSVGTYNESETTVTMPVSLHGGYQWVDTRYRYWARFQQGSGATLIDGGMLAFTVQGVTNASVRLDALHIASANGGTDGGASIALRALNSDNVRLSAVRLEAGLGAEGPQGGQGAKGVDGDNGGTGEVGGVGGGYGGAVGKSKCGGDDRSGGEGGQGNDKLSGEKGGMGLPNTPGGDGGVLKDADFCSGTKCLCDGAQGFAGDTGDGGAPGQAGDAGTGEGSLQNGIWQPGLPSARGTTGLTGKGGGGGGGGGGCNVKARVVATGGGGGGGGGAGCGGTGGEGGGAGGASIALLAFNAQVTLEQQAVLSTRGGGRGGNGGEGGPGGQGGEPGAGAPRSTVVLSDAGVSGDALQYETSGGPGGPGGRGGNGGAGGAGGGGAGGPSVVIWCANAGISLKVPSLDLVHGNGGAGGTSSQGPTGSPGASVPSIGCTFIDAGTP